MITGVGIDLVEIARVQKAIGRSSFLEKIYTEKERELIAVRSVRAAGNFAAKEAVSKALGSGFAGIAPREIEILRQPSGMPYVVLHGKARERARSLGIFDIQISITDTTEYAQACAVCQTAGTVIDMFGSQSCKKHVGGNAQNSENMFRSVLDAVGMKEADRFTIEELGIPSLVLMERAALAVADRVMLYATCESKIGVLCGTGNNGGDGVAVARLLHEAGYTVEVLLKETEVTQGTPEFLQQIKIARACGVPVCPIAETKDYDIIVDALFGIGLSKPIEGIYATVLEQVNKESHIVIAVDIASGISASNGVVCGVALRADETVTFGAAKCGHLLYPGKEYTGKLTVADIGFPTDVLQKNRQGFYLEETAVNAMLPTRPAYSNKGTFGKVAVVAGSKNMAGAAYFAACAAYRTGAGLVKIVTPECNREILQTLLPEAMLTTYTEETAFSKAVQDVLQFADALVIGSGLGQSAEAEQLTDVLQKALREKKETAPLTVWDADALNIIAKKMQKENMTSEEERIVFLNEWLPERSILTPHPGELSRLLGVPTEQLTVDFLAMAKRLSAKSNHTFVLKDAVTLVTQNGKIFFNTTGNNGMATGGSGDILCGVIAALAAAGMDGYDAASAGVWLHGAAGDAARERVGAAPMIARDLLQAIGTLFEEKRKEVMK